MTKYPSTFQTLVQWAIKNFPIYENVDMTADIMYVWNGKIVSRFEYVENWKKLARLLYIQGKDVNIYDIDLPSTGIYKRFMKTL